jgi:predicted nuclease with TOPRIM domain
LKLIARVKTMPGHHERLTYQELDSRLSEQLDLVSNLLKLVCRQERILRAGKADEIASLNYAKSALLQAMRPGAEAVQNLDENWQELRQTLEAHQRQRIDKKVRQIRRMVNEILRMEKRSERQIQSARRAQRVLLEGQWNTSIAHFARSE